jgi:hypothetical protein
VNDIPCRCGHREEEHQVWDDQNNFFCGDCAIDPDLLPTEFCVEYIPDNLTFIEQEARRRKLL